MRKQQRLTNILLPNDAGFNEIENARNVEIQAGRETCALLIRRVNDSPNCLTITRAVVNGVGCLSFVGFVFYGVGMAANLVSSMTPLIVMGAIPAGACAANLLCCFATCISEVVNCAEDYCPTFFNCRNDNLSDDEDNLLGEGNDVVLQVGYGSGAGSS